MSITFDYHNDLVVNPAARCPCMLVLDASSSMRGSRIDELNRGVSQFVSELKSDDVAASSVEIGVVTFGHQVEQVQPLTCVDDIIDVGCVDACGMTPMGQAVELAIQKLEARKQQYQQNGVSYYQPWLVLMTDGEPNDHWQVAAQKLKNLAQNKKMVVLCIGIGEDANLSLLSEFSAMPPKQLYGLKFKEFFLWLSQSMMRVSASTPGDSIRLPSTQSWDSLDI